MRLQLGRLHTLTERWLGCRHFRGSNSSSVPCQLPLPHSARHHTGQMLLSQLSMERREARRILARACLCQPLMLIGAAAWGKQMDISRWALLFMNVAFVSLSHLSFDPKHPRSEHCALSHRHALMKLGLQAGTS